MEQFLADEDALRKKLPPKKLPVLSAAAKNTRAKKAKKSLSAELSGEEDEIEAVETPSVSLINICICICIFLL